MPSLTPSNVNGAIFCNQSRRSVAPLTHNPRCTKIQ